MLAPRSRHWSALPSYARLRYLRSVLLRSPASRVGSVRVSLRRRLAAECSYGIMSPPCPSGGLPLRGAPSQPPLWASCRLITGSSEPSLPTGYNQPPVGTCYARRISDLDRWVDEPRGAILRSDTAQVEEDPEGADWVRPYRPPEIRGLRRCSSSPEGTPTVDGGYRGSPGDPPGGGPPGTPQRGVPGGSLGGPWGPPWGPPPEGGSRGGPGGGPRGAPGGPGGQKSGVPRETARVELIHQHLSRLGELLNTLENVHPPRPGGPGGAPPGGPPRGGPGTPPRGAHFDPLPGGSRGAPPWGSLGAPVPGDATGAPWAPSSIGGLSVPVPTLRV